MDTSDMIQPLRHFKKGQCIKCLAPLFILESEISTTILGQNGMPSLTSLDKYEVHGFCPNCGMIYEVEKDCMVYDIVLDNTYYTLKRAFEENEKEENGPNPFSMKYGEK